VKSTFQTPSLHEVAMLSLHEVAVRCGVELQFVEQLVEIGIIEVHSGDPTQLPGDAAERRVPSESTLRVHRAARLQRDLGVNLEGAAVILELLEQIESLEHELRGLRRG
jgi:chaperone modulatory protein CbpM